MALEQISFTPSGNIGGIWHDPETQTLIIRYHHRNRVYRYPGVPAADANGFAQSLSANDYLQQYITSQYTGELVGSLAPSSDPAADENALIELLGLK